MSKTKTRSKEKEKHPPYLGTREIVFTNLLLLGFEPGDMESKYNIPFTKDMFALPNKKAFEVVMYFLLGRLNPVMAAEKFRFCWPISDKKQEQVFRRAISDWLQEITKEDPDAHLPRIVPSLFLSPGGDKFYTLLLHFTRYVVYKAIRGEHGEKERDILRKPHLAPGVGPLSSVMLETYQAAAARRQKRTLEQTQVTLLVQKQWQEFISELVKDNRALSKTVRDLERKVKDLYAKSYDQAQARGEVLTSRRRSGVRSDGESQLLAVKRAEKLQKVRELWKVVDGLMTSQAPEKEVVESILQEVAMKSKLDADDIHVQVPELLLRECEAEIQRRSISNVYQGGKLNLLSLIQLWNLALQLYVEKIQQAPLARFDSMAPSVVTQVHTHHAHLSNAQAVRTSLAKRVEELKSSIRELKQERRLTPRRGTHRTFQSSTFGLSLLPSTPPVSFEPASSGEDTPVRLHGIHQSTLHASHPPIDSTPEAVTQMSQAVDKAALRTSGLVQGTPSSLLKDLRQQRHGQSRLPVPTVDSTPSHAGGRNRLQSAPTKMTSNAYPSLVQSRPKPTPGLSHRKQVTRLARTTTTKLDDSGNRRKDDVAEGGGKGAAGGRRKQMNNNASSSSSTRQVVNKAKATPKATHRAHRILVDQIVDSVISGDGVVDSISPLLLQSTKSHESPPVVASLKDPLAALDQSAFVSRDKLTRTPDDHAASPIVPSSARNDLLQQATRNLFTTPTQTDDVTYARIQNNVTESRQRAMTPLVDDQDDDLITSTMRLSMSPLMNLDSDKSPALRDTSTDESRDLRTQNGSLSPPDLQSSVGGSTQRSKSAQSPHIQVSKSAQSPLLQLNPVYKPKTGGTPPGLPLEDLEQTLLEITRTKTPQLPTRARQRTGSSQQRAMSPLAEGREDDLITSTTRLSMSPLMMNLDFDQSPALGDTSPDELERIMRTGAGESKSRTGGIDELGDLREWNPSHQIGHHTKLRSLSGGSQKSVTFSDHIDHHSFQDMSNVSEESPEGVEYNLKDPTDADGRTFDVHTQEAYEYIEVQPIELNKIPPDNTNSGTPLDDDDFSDTYLKHSPRSKEDHSQSPLDSVLQSQFDNSDADSPDPARRMQLLEHISPMITPSKTPKLATRKGVFSQGRVSAAVTNGSGDSLGGLGRSTGYENTPPVRDDSLVQGFSNLKLSGSSFRNTGGVQQMQDEVQQSPRANLDFSGLFDEDDSILLSASPLSRSLHQDGIDYVNVTSPPVQNLIDI